jgi:hypothetical protein
MPDRWQTYALEFKGGLITNVSPLQHGINAPGSARILRNYEPSIEGGYRSVQGYDKYDSDVVPAYGTPLVHGNGQSGTTLIIGNIFESPLAGDVVSLDGGAVDGAAQTGTTLNVDGLDVAPSANDTFTIAGDTAVYTVSAATALVGTASTLTITPAIVTAPADDAVLSFRYTIATGGVSFSSVNKRATLTLDQTMVVNPSDQDAVSFPTAAGLILGVSSFESFVVAARNSDVFKSSGSGWTKVNTPNYGSVLVDGAAQTGTSLVVDGITGTPQAGDTFTIAGVDLIYTITATPTVTSGSATFTIDPALNSSPADNAAITMLTTDRSGMAKHRFAQFNYNSTDYLAGVDGANVPFVYDGSTFTALDGIPTDGIGASHVANFKNQLFFGKGSTLLFTAPFTFDDFSAASGGGVINVGNEITGLIIFREQLIIFSERTIFRLVGNTIGDFQLQPITLDTGCVETDTIQEIGGDVVYLGPDGIRSLSATDRVGDFSLAVVSKVIQNNVTNFVNRNTSFSSVVIRPKSQYRLLGYNANFSSDSAQGVIASQTADGMQFAELRGFKAYVASSNLNADIETIVFANDSGYVYQMESGNSLDGQDIYSTFATPYIPINDPRIRKTIYRLVLYTDPQGSFFSEINLLFDFNEAGIIQPTPFVFDNSAASNAPAFYGTSIFGTSTYGGTLQRIFESQTVGSGYVVSLQFRANSTNPPHSLDSATLEYGTYGRR